MKKTEIDGVIIYEVEGKYYVDFHEQELKFVVGNWDEVLRILYVNMVIQKCNHSGPIIVEYYFSNIEYKWDKVEEKINFEEYEEINQHPTLIEFECQDVFYYLEDVLLKEGDYVANKIVLSGADLVFGVTDTLAESPDIDPVRIKKHQDSFIVEYGELSTVISPKLESLYDNFNRLYSHYMNRLIKF